MSVEQGTQGLEQIASSADFTRELQALRERAGLTIREVAKAAGTPLSTTGDYFSGKHLPLDREQFAQIIGACGETEPRRVEAWQRALARLRRAPGRRAGSPYRGLARFEAADERLFFGREDITDLIAFLAEQPSDLPLMLVGASGAGKSSLLRAGLLPRLRAAAEAAAAGGGDRVTIYDLTVIGAAKLTSLAACDEATSGAETRDSTWGLPAEAQCGWRQTAGRPAVIVDQFEAVFTLCADEDERAALISALCALAEKTLVVLALRADFYGEAIRYPRLLRALQERHVVLGPMNAEQVRRAVVEPARQARTEVEDGLVEVILADLAPHPGYGQGEGQAYDRGALPLLSHAMLTTWERGRGAAVTVADYRASGGIRDALTRSAERAYEGLTPSQRLLAKRLLLRLVRLADDLPPSRAFVPLAELRRPGAGDGSGVDVDEVLDAFVRERMITLDADSAQLTHDALLTAWPRLRAWTEEDAESLRERRRIAEGAKAWLEAGREEAALWRGSQLAIAREWAGDRDRRSALPEAALRFVDASVAADTVRERLKRRQIRRLRGTVAVLAVLVLAVAGVTGYAFNQRAAARGAEQAAVAAANTANSRDIAFTADQLRAKDPAVAAQLSVEAYDLAPTPQATASLLASSGASTVARIDDSASIVQWVAVSPNRRLLVAAGDDGTLRLWNVTVPGRPVLVSDLVGADPSHPLYAAAFSPNGKLLAAAGAGQAVTLWEVSGTRAVRLAQPLTGPAGTVYSVAFSPDSATLAAASSDGTVRLWHVADPARATADGVPLVPHGPAGTYPNTVAFSPDGQELAAGTTAGQVWLWRLPAAGRLAAGAGPVLFPQMPLRGPADPVSGVAFSPNGGELAASSKDFKVWLWRIGSGRAVPDGALTGSANWVNSVAFSPDGRSLAAGTSGSAVLVWNLTTRTVSATLPYPQPVNAVAWDGPDRLAAAGADGTVSLWALPAATLATGGPPTNVAYSPDGTTIAVGASSIQLWSAATHTLLASRPLPPQGFTNAITFRPQGAGEPLVAVAVSNGTVELLNGRTLAPVAAPFPVISGNGAAESVAFSPDGRLLATGADDGTVRLFDVTDPAHPRQVAAVRGANSTDPIYTVVFAPDGKLVAAASVSNVVQLWRVTGPDGHGLTPAGPDLGGMASYPIGLAFTPDGRTLAIGNADKHVYLWNVASPARPQQLGTPLSGPSGNVWAIAISPDGRTLAAGANDGSVWLWNLAAPAHPTIIATLSGLPGHVFSVAFSPDGAQLAAASYDDDTVRLWDTSPAAARAMICTNLGQPLSKAEWASYVPGVPYRTPCSPAQPG